MSLVYHGTFPESNKFQIKVIQSMSKKIPTIKLSNGYTTPRIGFGTYMVIKWLTFLYDKS